MIVDNSHAEGSEGSKLVVGASGIITLEVGPGIMAEDQLVAVFQSVLVVPVQVKFVAVLFPRVNSVVEGKVAFRLETIIKLFVTSKSERFPSNAVAP